MSTPASSNAAILPGSRPRGGSSKAATAVAQVWPSHVPLECGVIRLLLEKQVAAKQGGAVGAQQKFPISHLKKLLLYCRGKGKSCYPNIRFSNWSHIATNKFGMSEELAWAYFETFDVVSEIGARDRLELLQLIGSCSSMDKLYDLRKRLSVDTVQFILFLLLQNAPRSSLKTPMVAAEEWPSPDSELRQKSAEHYHLMFLRANLQGLLEMLQEPELVTLSEEAVKALGFVFSAVKNSRECTLFELAVSTASHSGYSKITRSFSVSQFEFWLRSLMVVNPFGPYNMLTHRRELQPATCFRSDGSGRLLINAMAPLKHRCSVLYRISKQTLASCDENLHHSTVQIKNCRRSNIYLLAPLKCVTVEKCSRCVLVLGAVSSTVVITNCDSLTVITACRRVHISSSTTCVLHLLTMTRPLLLPGSLHITLAPYNTHYPTLGSHLEATGLSHTINYWDSPINLTADTATPTWEVMPANLFRPMEVPFDLPGPTQEIPWTLPPVYLQAMDTKRERMKRWYTLVQQSQLTTQQDKHLETTVKEHFEEWLMSEGHMKELLDLGYRGSSSLPSTLHSASHIAQLQGKQAESHTQQTASHTQQTASHTSQHGQQNGLAREQTLTLAANDTP